jgi:palmitoyl-protein thioesterase
VPNFPVCTIDSNDFTGLLVVVWHGLAQDCCSGDTEFITSSLKQAYPDTYIKAIRIGSVSKVDLLASQFGNANNQVSQICKELKNDKRLQQGFNAIGISQVNRINSCTISRN